MRLTAANQAITPASMRSVFSSRPMPSAKRRTARGLSRATGKPCAHSKAKDCFSYPPVASLATSSTPCCRQKTVNSARPSEVLGKERAGPWGPIPASREKEETSNHLGHGNLPCTCAGSLATVRSYVTAAAVPKLPRGGCQRGYGRRPPRAGLEISNPSQRHSHLNLSPLSRYKGAVIVNQISGVSRRGGIWTFRSKLNWRCGAEIPTWSGRGDVPFPALLFCSSWAGLDPCLGPADTPKELHAIPSTESHPQYGLLQAHALVAIPSGHAAHLFLPRIARRHV